MIRLALASVSTEDLLVLRAIAEAGKADGEWKEHESAAVSLPTGVFEQGVLRAGYRSVAEFQRPTEDAELRRKAGRANILRRLTDTRDCQ